MRFCWTTISVKDMDASISFYQDLIGLKLNRRVKVNDVIELAFLGEDETQVELKCDVHSRQINHSNDISLGFIVNSIDQFTEFLDSKGIFVQSGPFQPDPSIKFIYIQDPDGLKIQLVENVDQGL